MTFLLSGDLEVFELVRQNGDADLFARVNGLGRYIYILRACSMEGFDIRGPVYRVLAELRCAACCRNDDCRGGDCYAPTCTISWTDKLAFTRVGRHNRVPAAASSRPLWVETGKDAGRPR
jgi:hypothetical protein